ncbi:cytochrome c/ABC transporter substrate-binding protein [Aquimarina sp. 2201CG14-23]|uniref:cytochrome c/ABC transporter substrate-binding protein n=1 Tax=Aquimarina mycalae TaxID=3040073 RepID=UPI0024780792|nr:ABC transporter substrate-binding protein [Aquimarina sp. 2201CG14-23]MDH7448115.1 c-type cytochrome [Aquimarina sp. 2201CG14-23]
MKQISLLFLLLLFFGFTTIKQSSIPTKYNGLTSKQKAGKDIYTKGIGVSDIKIMAEMSGVQVPATIMPCINCHKADGTGNPEGGIIPSNITWNELTKNYGGKRLDSKKRPPYTEKSLRKVITTGMDSGNNQLNTAMPKYNMSREDIDNLIEYIKILGTDKEVGVTNSSISIGVVVPESTSVITNNKNKAIKKLVQAYCAAINDQGGIYNRKIFPIFLNADELQNRQDFFMVLGFGDKRVAKNVNQKSIPALLSYAKEKASSGLHNPYTFYAFPSLTAQSLSLVDFSKQKQLLQKETKATIIYYNDPIRKSISEEVATYYFQNFGKRPTIVSLHENNIKETAENSEITTNGLLYYIGPNTLGDELLSALYKVNKSPNILLPGSLSGIDIFKAPSSFNNKIFIGYPTWITEQTTKGIQVYQDLAQNYGLDSKWKRTQLDMLSMLLTTGEGLKRIGRNLSRERFIKTMEGFFEYSNGLGPSITYNLNQRVGNPNVYIVGFNSTEKKMKLIATVHSKEQ